MRKTFHLKQLISRDNIFFYLVYPGVGRRPTQSGLFPGDFSSSDGTEQIQDDDTPQKKHLTHIFSTDLS